MNDEDLPGNPFAAFDAERTVIKAGGAQAAPSAAAFAAEPGPNPAAGMVGPGGALPLSAADSALSLDALMAVGMNPLVAAAAPLLAAAPRLRATPRHPDPAALKEALVQGLHKFEAQARAQGLPHEQVIAARYVLCTLLDEAAASTPWGGSGAWAASSLLVRLHNEAWGGEKVFQLITRLAENVAANRALLELICVALSLGFEGRYRVLDNGRAQLDAVRERLVHLLRQGVPPPEPALSPHWQGVARGDSRLRERLPLWLLATLSALALAAVLLGFRLALGQAAEPVFQTLAGLHAPSAQAATLPAPAPAGRPRLAAFLQPEIDAGLVQVQDFVDRSVVTIRGDGFFESGSAVIAAPVRSLLPRIAQALSDTPGAVLVTGHTDDQAIRTLRYPSNWHLSQDRADAVKAELAKTVAPGRLRAEGRADSESVDNNATPGGRARNRRVEITLLVRPAPGARPGATPGATPGSAPGAATSPSGR